MDSEGRTKQCEEADDDKDEPCPALEEPHARENDEQKGNRDAVCDERGIRVSQRERTDARSPAEEPLGDKPAAADSDKCAINQRGAHEA